MVNEDDATQRLKRVVKILTHKLISDTIQGRGICIVSFAVNANQ